VSGFSAKSRDIYDRKRVSRFQPEQISSLHLSEPTTSLQDG
jgi:hypothetical protein